MGYECGWKLSNLLCCGDCNESGVLLWLRLAFNGTT